jgi:hypothetical protein
MLGRAEPAGAAGRVKCTAQGTKGESPMVLVVVVVIAALSAGYVAGLVSFKKTNEFCDRHGVTRTCPICPEVGQRPTSSAIALSHFSSAGSTTLHGPDGSHAEARCTPASSSRSSALGSGGTLSTCT